jgi:gluconolactonase
MMHQALHPEFHKLLDVDTPVRSIGSGFMFTEGPIWHPREQFLLFSDLPGDTRRRWSAADGVTVHARPSNKTNGTTRDAELHLLACEHATSSVVRWRDGVREVLATHFEGKELNSPNDLVVADDGAVLFTDPTYGRMPGFGIERPTQLGFQGVYRIAPGGGAPELLVPRDMFTQPNGLCFSPDGALLYVNDTVQTNIRVFAVRGATLQFLKVFASGIVDVKLPGVPDGMKCDANGNVWVTAPGGLWVYAPDATLLGKIAIPENSANLHWGGADWRTLFVTATTSVYALTTRVAAHREPFMRG